MKRNKINAYILVIGLALILNAKALALDLNTEGKVSAEVTSAKVEDSAKMSASARVDSEDNSTSSEKDSEDRMDKEMGDGRQNMVSNKEDNEDSKDNGTSTDSKIGDEHKSTVAKFVQNLLSVADREGGIGEQVRLIAQEQNESSSTTVEAIAKVESKGGFTRFLFGADYKNLGTIRSELAKTSDRISKLTNLASSSLISVSDKQELNAQIDALKMDQVKLNSFVDANENKFSLLGWFVKLFNK